MEFKADAVDTHLLSGLIEPRSDEKREFLL